MSPILTSWCFLDIPREDCWKEYLRINNLTWELDLEYDVLVKVRYVIAGVPPGKRMAARRDLFTRQIMGVTVKD